LRTEKIGAAGELLGLAGGFVPFSKTAADRKAVGDPRPSISQRYPTWAEYRTAYQAAAEKLVADRYLLPEDLPRVMALCEALQATVE
jgi:hypothetical protein